jgi:predicted ATPase/class 3 adenylate cyclase
VQQDLPSGTVTFLFTDVESSTRLLGELGTEDYASALSSHRERLRQVFAEHGGIEVDTQGDAFFVAFPTAPAALSAATKGMAALSEGPLRVRMGIHTGTPMGTDDGYVGIDVHRAARVMSAAHGGQVLVSETTRALAPADVRLRNLGRHRLKDLIEAQPLYQLGEGDFPPPKTLSQTSLPVQPTPLIGRETELADVLKLLDESRLVTLTGVGGSGKTRLALQVAAEFVDECSDGVWWVPLAALRDPALVESTIEQLVGAKNGLREHLADKHALLLLDNFEQVVAAAPLLAGLLSATSSLRMLVTSRERLALAAEYEYQVPTLGLEDAVALFTARARQTDARFQADEDVHKICRRLDGLPLALELAAARIKSLAAAAILERLDEALPVLTGGARDVPERQRTLRATMDWSYDLLSLSERQLFARLSVFAGGCTLDSAETVADAHVDTLGSLVDKSLVSHSNGRYSMLDTVRGYAHDRLDETGAADELHRRHAKFFLTLVEEAEHDLLGPTPGKWLEQLEVEHDNVRAGLDWLRSAGETEFAQRLAGAVWEFWCLRGHFNEGMHRLEEMLAMDERPTLARAKVLTGFVHLGVGAESDVQERKRRAEEALELYRVLEDPWGTAYAEFQLAQALAHEGDFESATPLIEESIARLREVGDEHRALQATRALAWCSQELGDVERSRGLTEDFLRRARETDDQQMEARALSGLGRVAADQGRVQEALELFADAYRVDREFGDPSRIAVELVSLAKALILAGKPNLAVQLLSLGVQRADDVGITGSRWVSRTSEEVATRAREQLGDKAFAEAWDAGRQLSADEAVELALSV